MSIDLTFSVMMQVVNDKFIKLDVKVQLHKNFRHFMAFYPLSAVTTNEVVWAEL